MLKAIPELSLCPSLLPRLLRRARICTRPALPATITSTRPSPLGRGRRRASSSAVFPLRNDTPLNFTSGPVVETNIPRRTRTTAPCRYTRRPRPTLRRSLRLSRPPQSTRCGAGELDSTVWSVPQHNLRARPLWCRTPEAPHFARIRSSRATRSSPSARPALTRRGISQQRTARWCAASPQTPPPRVLSRGVAPSCSPRSYSCERGWARKLYRAPLDADARAVACGRCSPVHIFQPFACSRHIRPSGQAIVGKDALLTILEDDALKPYIDKLEPPADGGAAAVAGGDAMEVRGKIFCEPLDSCIGRSEFTRPRPLSRAAEAEAGGPSRVVHSRGSALPLSLHRRRARGLGGRLRSRRRGSRSLCRTESVGGGWRAAGGSRPVAVDLCFALAAVWPGGQRSSARGQGTRVHRAEVPHRARLAAAGSSSSWLCVCCGASRGRVLGTTPSRPRVVPALESAKVSVDAGSCTAESRWGAPGREAT